MKRICSVLLTLALSLALSLSLAAPALAAEGQTVHASLQSPRVFVEDVEVGFMDSDRGRREPIVYDDMAYFPLTTIGQWMGADTVWNAAAKTVTITASGAEPVYYSTYAFNDMDIKRLEGTEQYQYDMQNGVDVQLCPDVTVTVNGERKTFTNAQGKAVCPILFRDCIYLPHQGVGELLGKQVTLFSRPGRPRWNMLNILSIYTAPTQAELAEAKFYFAEARKHMDTVTALLRADAPSTTEEFVDTVRKIQTELNAITDCPFPAFKGAEVYADIVRGYAADTLTYYVTYYLPKEETGTAKAEFWSYPPKKQWEKFASAFFPKGEDCATYFSYMEEWVGWSEEFMASVEAGPDGLTAFTDAADITRWEAVATLTQLGVIQGKEDGSYFDPAGTVTRAEAAKLIAVMMFGGGKNDVIARGMDLIGEDADTAYFPDIEGHWSEQYIKYCVDTGILNGRADGTFDPNGNVTAIELCKMALAMLGYDAAAYKLTGENWAEQTNMLARICDPSLYSGFHGLDLNQPIDREDAAQILYNALRNPVIMPKEVHGNTEGTLEFSTHAQADGSLMTFFQQRFTVTELPEIPAQPRNSKER